MKHLLMILSLALFAASGCKNKSESGAGANTENVQGRESVVAGDVQKEWKAKRETNAQGEKEKLDRDEKKERVIFYRNGNVTMTSDNASQQGKWTLEGNQMRIVFDGAANAEVFDVVELDKNTIRLRAGDGSELTLKPE